MPSASERAGRTLGERLGLRHRSIAGAIAHVFAPQAAAAEDLARYDWRARARPEQLPPGGDWTTRLILAGRGFGKTRTGAEFVREEVEARRARRIALVAPTAADARDTMVEGESGLLSVFPPHQRPTYEPSKRRVTFHTGAIATLFSADEPERLRGPQHDLAWCDELAAWRYLTEAWDQLMFGLRLGRHPRVCVTTTPKPLALVKELLKDASTAVTRGSTYANRANLAASFFAKIVAKYEGTRLGRQELNAEVLEDIEGALWTLAMIERSRMTPEVFATLPRGRLVVALDPNVSAKGEGADEAGIVAAMRGVGPCPCGGRDCAYVLHDASGQMGAAEWAKATVETYDRLKADRVVAEVNQGGALVEMTLRVVSPAIAVSTVRAAEGKRTRAEPVAALYEQGRVHHVGAFPQLEDQLTQWVPDSGQASPGRLDALVWALTDLMLGTSTGLLDFYAQEAEQASAAPSIIEAIAGLAGAPHPTPWYRSET